MAKRTSGAAGSAAGKATDLTAKKGTTQRGIESEKTEGRGAVKARLNMGGRNILGERVRDTKRRAGR